MIAMTCQSCGAPLDRVTADGLCPACLLRGVLETEPPDEKRSDDPPRLTLPRNFGPYCLLGELGRGGMGVVYRAQQVSLDRTVAVKLLLAGAYSSEAALHRFRLEAAAAAGLQHPNIVEVHDYGEVDGQPYYAMDLVTGTNLAELCDGRPLPVRRAAELLRLLAGATHYAHRRGIVHRDLKPSNVLVDEAGRPRITDFGLAKVLAGTEGATMTRQMLGSPGYAAPEQAAGRVAEVGVASDVYGLGALFYHLVTGRAPFNAATPAETLRLVLDTEPPPPRLLNPALPHDLETICLKCLAREPAGRYATAAEVVDDVERFLAEQPIRAQPPGMVYRMRKFTRRHRVGVAATAAVVVALAGGFTAALVGFHWAVVQRQAADAARGEAEQLVELMTDDLKPALEQRGGLPQLVQLTEAAVHYYETLPPALRSTKTDFGHADALSALARLRGIALDDRRGAEVALRAALVLREKIARANPGDPAAAAAWLWDEWELPWITGDTAEQYSEVRQDGLVGRWRALQARFPESAGVKRGLAEVLALYAQCAATDFGKPKEAVAAGRQCRALVEELVAARPLDKTLGDLVEKSLRGLATALHQAGEAAEAMAVSEQAVAYCNDALKADPGNVKLRERAAEAARNLCYRAFTTNVFRSREAERLAREHYRVLTELSPDNQEYRYLYALSHMMEANYHLIWDPDPAATRKAFQEFHALLGPFVGRRGYEKHHEQWTLDCLYLAAVAAWACEPAEARREIERARGRCSDWSKLYPEGSFDRHLIRSRFLCLEGWAFYWLRDWPGVAKDARESLVEIESGLRQQPEHAELLLRRAVACSLLGIAVLREGRSGEAIDLLQPAIATMGAAPSASSVYELSMFTRFAQLALVEALAQHGERERAREAAARLVLGVSIFGRAPWGEQEWKARVLTLAATLCGPEERVRSMVLADRAERLLPSPAALGRLTIGGMEDRATIARLRAATATTLELGELERVGRGLDEAAAADPDVIERLTRAGEAAWDFGASSTFAPTARMAELAAREGYLLLMDRDPENQGYRFLFAETHRMDCYTHLDCDGLVEQARAAFRGYDELLEPFVGRKGYDSVLRTRLANSLYLSQLSASMGDRAEAERWIQEAGRRFETYRARLPEGSAERALARLRFNGDLLWSAWWLRDWPEVARLAQEAKAEVEGRLVEQPANEELLLRAAMIEGFGALAGAGPAAEAVARLAKARDSLSLMLGRFQVKGAVIELWMLEDAAVEACRKAGDMAQARKSAGEAEAYFGLAWGADGPGEYWRGQKHLARVRLQAASVLDPSVPAGAARRKELLVLAAAALAPDKVAGRLTVDVREMLQELAVLRGQ
jgi:hypothetical protein